MVACDEQICFAALGKFEERLILWIAADDETIPCWFYRFAVGEIVSEQLDRVFRREPELGIAENPREFSNCSARDERNRPALTPMLPQPGQTAAIK